MLVDPSQCESCRDELGSIVAVDVGQTDNDEVKPVGILLAFSSNRQV